MNCLHASVAAVVASLAMVTLSWGAPLSLQDCLQKARDHNPALKSAAWDSRIAEEGSRLAAVDAYPRIDAHAGYTMQLEPQAVKIGGATAETQEPEYAFAGLAASYTIYDFGRRDARIRKAQAYTKSAQQGFLFSTGDAVLQVVEAYFKLLEADKLLQAADEEITRIAEHRRIAQVLLEEGVVTRNDVLQADVRLASARQKRLAIANSRENGWLLLNFLTGSEPGFRGELDVTTAIAETPPAAAPPAEDVTAHRTDIKAEQHLLAAREFEVQEKKENYLPELYTRVALDYVQNDKVREQAIYSATLGIRVNLFDGYAAQAAHEQALKQRSKQQETVRLTEQRARS
ncbi:MAG: TolC family protein, partial [Desulfuromonadaceae bacterium]|nr:TolC family protein [Desulfuromonadaceae bacterium]